MRAIDYDPTCTFDGRHAYRRYIAREQVEYVVVTDKGAERGVIGAARGAGAILSQPWPEGWSHRNE